MKTLLASLLLPTLRAVAAAARMPVTTHAMSDPLRTYLTRTDTAHRGGWTMRLRREVLARLPGH
jgi:hypothetical protein